jgi:hypothetical protein
MLRWAGAIIMLLVVANALFNVYDERGKKFFFIRTTRVSPKTG